ncbi:MAG: hypothetical protein ACYC41_04555 [Bacillota bacterium]
MGNNNGGDHRRRNIIRGLQFGVLGFALGVPITLASESAMRHLNLVVAFVALLAIVLLNIAFDIIGIAVAVAEEKPFHALSAKRLPGAVQAIRLIRNAEKVAGFANDVVGDISGTISGAAGAAILVRLAVIGPSIWDTLISVAFLSLIAAITVGGKAAGKGVAIDDSFAITYAVGRFLFWLENRLGWAVLAEPPRARSSPDRKNGRN